VIISETYPNLSQLSPYGEAYFKQQKYDLAKQCFNLVNYYYTPNKEKLTNYKFLTAIASKTNTSDVKLAQTYLQLANDVSVEEGHLKRAYKRLAEAYKLAGNVRKSQEYYWRVLFREKDEKKKENIVSVIKTLSEILLADISGNHEKNIVVTF
jgi:tetratricopeptide (TPR) repeat protein